MIWFAGFTPQKMEEKKAWKEETEHGLIPAVSVGCVVRHPVLKTKEQAE